MPATLRVLRIGLTGGIASGKSTVAQRFAELGVPVIDSDQIARDVVAPGQTGLAAVAQRFGTGVLATDGSLDRRMLRERVFSDPDARKQLEAILHPLIRAEMQRRSELAGGPYQVHAIPLLVEGGGRDRVDRVLVVDVEPETQVARVMARDGSSESEAHAILAAQASREARLAAADDVLVNNQGVAELRRAVDSLHQKYLKLAAARLAAQPTKDSGLP
jgi:dephospho-CoA kinase